MTFLSSYRVPKDSPLAINQFKRHLTSCSHDCKSEKCVNTLKTCTSKKENNAINDTCSDLKEDNAIYNTYSAFSEAGVGHLDGFYSAKRYKKLLQAHQFQNNIKMSRNYSSDENCSEDSDGEDDKKEKNLAAVLNAVDDLRLEQRPIPKISDRGCI